MTLIVVDQFRTTADSYATFTHPDGEVTTTVDYCKIHSLPQPIHHEFGQSFNTIAFTGDAVGFWNVYGALLTTIALHDLRVTDDDLVALAVEHAGECSATEIIIPCPSAVLVLAFGDGAVPTIEYRPGAVHCFGGAYQPAVFDDENETRAWFSIFIDTKRAGRLDGDRIHFLRHDSDQIKTDTVMPASKAKKFKSRFPFRRRAA